MLQSLLKTTERVVQEIDSVEYGSLTSRCISLSLVSSQNNYFSQKRTWPVTSNTIITAALMSDGSLHGFQLD